MSLEQTLTVDPSGEADETTIQDAIDRILPDPDVRWTVLVYAGTYAEAVTLPSTKGNVDIVGVDRDSVIIHAIEGVGVTITGSGSRKNSIRNMTIRTTGTQGGHGIVVEKSDTEAPTDIEISDVTVEAAGTDKVGMDLSQADGVRVHNCKVRAAAGHGMVLGDNCNLTGVTVETTGPDKNGIDLASTTGVQMDGCTVKAAGAYGVVLGDNCKLANVTAEAMGTNGKAVRVGGKSHVVISDSTFKGKALGLEIGNVVQDIQFVGSEFRSWQAVWVWAEGSDILFQNCRLIGDEGLAPDQGTVYAFHLDSIGDLAITLQSCYLV